MKENLPSTVSFAFAVTCLALAVLSARLARAPEARHFRYSAAASFAGSVFCLGQSLLVAGLGDAVVVWAARMTLAAGCLHQAAWLRFVSSWLHRAPTRAERILFWSCVGAAALVLVPGLGTGDMTTPRRLIGFEGTISQPEPHAVGLLGIALSVAAQIHIVRSGLRSRREAPRARALVAAFLLLLLLGAVDGAIVTFGLPFPLVAGLGVVTVSVGVGTAMVEGALDTSKALVVKTSELDRAHGELAERQRLASLGELAAVVAHEVRNPLAVVFNALAGLRRLPPRGEDDAVLLGIIDEEAHRLKRLVATLLDAVRPFKPQVTPHELATVVSSAVALATRHDTREIADVTVELDVPPGATFVFDDVLVVQALSNLVSNALDAPGRSSPVLVHVTTNAGETPRVRFEVTDDGAGVDETDRERIFDSFFTTRATGTGLGLTLVKRIAEAHGGVAFHELPEEGGARFVFELPVPSPSPSPLPSPSA